MAVDYTIHIVFTPAIMQN